MYGVTTQRENILYTRCHISIKVCNMIIVSGIYANVTSTTCVRQLNPNTIKHERPYRLQWLN